MPSESIICQSENLLLHHDKAIYWPRQKMLLCSDLHLGKEHAFARAGIGIPSQVSSTTLQRLAALIQEFDVEKLIVLGDFFHAVPNRDEPWIGELEQFLDRHGNIDVQVVSGNHDNLAAISRIDSRIQWHHESQLIEPFVLQHEPGRDARGFVLCGHLHPTFRVGGKHIAGLQGPVFWVRKDHLVMPAFGEFTGGLKIEPKAKDRVFITGPDCIIPIINEPAVTH